MNSIASTQRTNRVPVNVSARISTVDPEIDVGSGERYFRVSAETCVDVSTGGAFVASDDTLPPGRRVHLEILLPGDATPIETIGRVAWSRARLTSDGVSPDSGMGIEFLGGPPEDLERIASFVAANQPQPRKRSTAPTIPTAPPRGA